MLKLKNLKIMQTDLIIINDYCTRCDIEPDFVRMLGEGGLIDVEMIDDTDCFPASQLGNWNAIRTSITICLSTSKASMPSAICSGG